MVEREHVQVDLVKLTGGERLLRLTDPQSGLSLEKKLDPELSVVAQKTRLFAALEAAVARAELNPA